MNGAPELQIAAEADGEVVQPAPLPVDGQQVGQSLGGMVVPPVAGVDDGHGGHFAGGVRGAFLGVAHGNDIGIAADHPHGIADGLALCGGAAVGLGKAQYAAPEAEHGRFKGEPGAGGGFKKEGGQLFVAAHLLVTLRFGNDILCHRDQLVDLLGGEIRDVNQVSHLHDSFLSIARPEVS